MKTELSSPQTTDDMERAFTDVCDELGCAHDNEAALKAVATLKRRFCLAETYLAGAGRLSEFRDVLAKAEATDVVS